MVACLDKLQIQCNRCSAGFTFQFRLNSSLMKIELPKQNNYEVAYNKAAGLLRDSDLGDTSSRCGVRVGEGSTEAQKGSTEAQKGSTEAQKGSTGEKILLVEYLGSEQRILMPEVRFQPGSLSGTEQISGMEQISFMEQILVLHYLTMQADHPSRGEYVAYKNLPGASFYSGPYRRRSVGRLLETFGDDPDELLSAAKVIGGTPDELGDVSARIRIFPKIEAVIVLHRGDEEFPPEAEILYRDDVINFLSLEDVSVLSGVLVSRLSKAKGQLKP